MNNYVGFKNNNGTNKTKKPQDTKRGLKAWEDDEKQNETKPVSTHKINENQIKNVNHVSNNPITNQYKKPSSFEPKTSTYDYENKIIDDVLEVSGISNKPTEGQLVEFIKRIRTLNKDVIWMLMNNRLTKFTSEGNVNDIKSLTNVLYVIERILKDNVSGYLDLIKQNSQLYQDVFNKNYDKKANTLCSSIYSILAGDTLLIKENNMVNSNKLNGNGNSIIDINTNNDNVMNLFSSTTAVNQNGDVNKGKTESFSKFQFIKKKPTDPLTINSINNNIPNINQPPVDLFNNIQSIKPPTSAPISVPDAVSSTTETKKPRLFNFINSKKTNENNTNTNQQQSNNGTDLFSQLNDLNFDQPKVQPITNNDSNNITNNTDATATETTTENTNGKEIKKELDMELFAKCFNETGNNANQYNPINQHNMIYQYNNQGQIPIGMGYMNPQPIAMIPINYPNGQNYPYAQVYNMPPNAVYNMPQPPYQYNPQYQPQYYPGSQYNQPPPQYQDMMIKQSNYVQQEGLPQSNGKQPETKSQKKNQPDPFGNLLDLMKSK